MKTTGRRKYTAEERASAVEQAAAWRAQGKPWRAIYGELGIGPSALWRWQAARRRGAKGSADARALVHRPVMPVAVRVTAAEASRSTVVIARGLSAAEIAATVLALERGC